MSHGRGIGRCFSGIIADRESLLLASGGPAGVAGAAEGIGVIVKTRCGTWRVQVKYRSAVVADRTFQRKGDAVRWEMEQKRLLLSGEFVSPSAGKITVRELAEEYRDSRQGQVSVRAWESDESALRVHIVPAFGRLPISSVASVQIERFLSDLAVSRSVRTAARVRTTLRGLFRYAVRTRRLQVSPAETVPLPHPDSRTGKVVEVHPFALDVLLDVVSTQREVAGRYADITLVLGLTGLRFGELRVCGCGTSSTCPTRGSW